MGTGEGERVPTTTTSRHKKPSSPRKSSTKNDAIIKKLLSNEHWPFDRVDGKILETLHKQHLQRGDAALL